MYLAHIGLFINDQLLITVRGINQAHELAEAIVSTSTSAVETVKASNDEIEFIIRNGTVFAKDLVIPSPVGLDADIEKAKNQIFPPWTEERKEKSSEIQKGRKCYTNGIITKKYKPEEKIPEGFYLGTHFKGKFR